MSTVTAKDRKNLRILGIDYLGADFEKIGVVDGCVVPSFSGKDYVPHAVPENDKGGSYHFEEVVQPHSCYHVQIKTQEDAFEDNNKYLMEKNHKANYRIAAIVSIFMLIQFFKLGIFSTIFNTDLTEDQSHEIVQSFGITIVLAATIFAILNVSFVLYKSRSSIDLCSINVFERILDFEHINKSVVNGSYEKIYSQNYDMGSVVTVLHFPVESKTKVDLILEKMERYSRQDFLTNSGYKYFLKNCEELLSLATAIPVNESSSIVNKKGYYQNLSINIMNNNIQKMRTYNPEKRYRHSKKYLEYKKNIDVLHSHVNSQTGVIVPHGNSHDKKLNRANVILIEQKLLKQNKPLISVIWENFCDITDKTNGYSYSPAWNPEYAEILYYDYTHPEQSTFTEELKNKVAHIKIKLNHNNTKNNTMNEEQNNSLIAYHPENIIEDLDNSMAMISHTINSILPVWNNQTAQETMGILKTIKNYEINRTLDDSNKSHIKSVLSELDIINQILEKISPTSLNKIHNSKSKIFIHRSEIALITEYNNSLSLINNALNETISTILDSMTNEMRMSTYYLDQKFAQAKKKTEITDNNN